MQIVLCEDNAVYRAYLVDVIQEIGLREDLSLRPMLLFEAGNATDVNRWSEAYGAPLAPNSALLDSPLVFLLDIQLPEGDDAGLTLAEALRARFPQGYIVFVTEQLSTVFRAFRTQPFDFLPKPVSTERLAATLSSISHHFTQRHGLPAPAAPTTSHARGPLTEPPAPAVEDGPKPRHARAHVPVDAAFPDPSHERWLSGGPDDILQIRSAGLIYRIRRDAIRYVQRTDDRTYIHEEGRTVSCGTSLEILEKELWTPDGIFLRCHRRTLVNLRYIASFDLDTCTLTLTGGQRFEVGHRYLAFVQGRIRK
jgi:DNA-binding LytR/AlgR family response regulator